MFSGRSGFRRWKSSCRPNSKTGWKWWAAPASNYGNAPFVRIDEKRIVDNATIEKVIDILREEYFAGGAE